MGEGHTLGAMERIGQDHRSFHEQMESAIETDRVEFQRRMTAAVADDREDWVKASS